MADTEMQSGLPCKVMVVDDNHDLALITALLLERHGFTVSTCWDGQTCLDTAQRLSPDIILLDIDMPGLNGIDTCKQLRAQVWGKDIPIIAYTGGDYHLHSKELAQAGFDAKLAKPSNFEELVASILNTIHLKRAA
jgi:DNA-binding response OmpR family regulator